MEQLDLYTKDRIPTGRTVKRGDPIPEGSYRLVVHICIFNSDGEMLIQKRCSTKKLWPDMWDMSVGGCVISGERSEEGARRELVEELGLDVSFENIRPIITNHFNEGFDDVYILTRDIDLESLTLQPEEVSAVRYASESEILSMIDKGTFISYRKEKIKYLFAMKDDRSVFTEKR